MRIVVDLQSAQTSSSRSRGIGRYSLSLVLAMARNRGPHEILIALNGLFPETIEPIRARFRDILPQENIRVWHAPGPLAELDPSNTWRRQSAIVAREAFLGSLRPDLVHVSSLFEGFEESAVTSIGVLPCAFPTAVTLYDLIPLIHQEVYLENSSVRKWYLGKIDHLRRADLWLAISESSRREGIDLLGLSESGSVNISADADAQFQPLGLDGGREEAIRQQYGLKRPFVLYTGGIDHRKNIEALIRAFARLPQALRQRHQLAIVCSITPENRARLEGLVARNGLDEDDVIMTGYIPDADLVSLYNICQLFVFPSWHEGFGLPVLEAMRCGAPVIGANASSIPEVIGWREALFDPHSEAAMAAAMDRALSDDRFRAQLVKNAQRQAANFSWEESARKALQAMEQLHTHRQACCLAPIGTASKPKLAYVSPLPPTRSGIADYSMELLPELAQLYDIVVIVDQKNVSDPWIVENCRIRSPLWFAEHAEEFARVVYHFGNSAFHQHMFKLLESIPGVVVLHDFFHSGVLAHMEAEGSCPGIWPQALYHSHGYEALGKYYTSRDRDDLIYAYPCSLAVIQQAIGLIVHSEHSCRLVSRWYGGDLADWEVIPHLRHLPESDDRQAARQALRFGPDDFVVCSFGMLAPTKLNHRLLRAWTQSRLGKNKQCYLLFVGENHQGDYGRRILAEIRRSQSGDNVRITGWVDRETFQLYLAAADLGVQLRTLSRGETSGTVLDCMCHGLATIVNANGSLADLDGQGLWKLSDQFADAQLVEALERLWEDGDCRRTMGERARAIIRSRHAPGACAAGYHRAIERFYLAAAADVRAIPQAVAGLETKMLTDNDLMALSRDIARSIAPRNRQRQLLVDISGWSLDRERLGQPTVPEQILRGWLACAPRGYRVEPVFRAGAGEYRYGRCATMRLLNVRCEDPWDDPIEIFPGDIFLAMNQHVDHVVSNQELYRSFRRQGLELYFVLADPPVFETATAISGPNGGGGKRDVFCTLLVESDGILCSPSIDDALYSVLTDMAKNESKACCRVERYFPAPMTGTDCVPDKHMHEEMIRQSKHFYDRFLMPGHIASD
jgi:glycosyltransferase involved in cell wall biosynthesis